MDTENLPIVATIDKTLDLFGQLTKLKCEYFRLEGDIEKAKAELCSASKTTKKTASIPLFLFLQLSFFIVVFGIYMIGGIPSYLVLVLVVLVILFSSILFWLLNEAAEATEKRIKKEMKRLHLAQIGVESDILHKYEELKNETRGLPDLCINPLALYIMREAAKETNLLNFRQAEQYFQDRYLTIISSSDEKMNRLKKQLDDATTESANLFSFLKMIEDKDPVGDSTVEKEREEKDE